MMKQARFAFEFCAIELCGKCTPCRVGSTRGVEVIDRLAANDRAREADRAGRRPLQHHEVRIALRARWVYALSGDERADAFPGRFSPVARRRGRGIGADAMNAMFDIRTLIEEPDYGTPASKAESKVTLTIDGRSVTVPGRHVDHAGGDGRRGGNPETLRHRHAGGLRLVPRVSGGDRRPRRDARLLHHAGRPRASPSRHAASGWTASARG